METNSNPVRTRNCRLCIQHGIVTRRIGHRCQFETCTCIKCNTIQMQRKIMSEQIRLRRLVKHQKMLNNGTDYINNYWCQRCRGHNVESLRRNHKPCPYADCNCNFCSLISARSKVEVQIKRNCLLTPQLKKNQTVSEEKTQPKNSILTQLLSSNSRIQTAVPATVPKSTFKLLSYPPNNSTSDTNTHFLNSFLNNPTNTIPVIVAYLPVTEFANMC